MRVTMFETVSSELYSHFGCLNDLSLWSCSAVSQYLTECGGFYQIATAKNIYRSSTCNCRVQNILGNF